jgi:hypothetical protein
MQVIQRQIRELTDIEILLFIAPITGGVAGTNPNASRSAGDPWLDWRDILDHWDAESANY